MKNIDSDKPISALWKSFALEVLAGQGISEMQMREMKKAFYSGAGACGIAIQRGQEVEALLIEVSEFIKAMQTTAALDSYIDSLSEEEEEWN